jgi:hypothetical protein
MLQHAATRVRIWQSLKKFKGSGIQCTLTLTILYCPLRKIIIINLRILATFVVNDGMWSTAIGCVFVCIQEQLCYSLYFDKDVKRYSPSPPPLLQAKTGITHIYRTSHSPANILHDVSIIYIWTHSAACVLFYLVMLKYLSEKSGMW